MFKVKDNINILDMLKSAGYSSYRISKGGIFGSATVQKFRNGGMPSWNELDKICDMLDCQPWDIVERVQDDHKGAQP